MCGIAGVFQTRADGRPEQRASSMIATLAHRGPDDEGVFVDDGGQLALAHRRLAIIDLSSRGHQPMQSPAGTVLSFNGEIYNFRAIRTELEREGIRFSTDSDTEVLLFALERWGFDALNRIEGMYAFAWWKPSEKELLLARDPLGIKPLYWMRESGRGMAFASELKAFRTITDSLRPNAAALKQYIDFGFVYSEKDTAIESIEKLPPGSFARFRDGVLVEQSSFWRLPAVEPQRALDIESSVRELRAVLETVIEQHLIADVPVGLLLSGGLDSSLIAALAARQTTLQTVTMSFGRSEIDESPHANRVAKFIGSHHQHLQLDPEEITEALTTDTIAIDDLFADWGVVTTRLLYRKCRELGMKVVLVGEGSDELFGGYPQFHYANGRTSTTASRFELFRRLSGKRYGSGYFGFSQHLTGRERGDSLFEQVRRFELRDQLPNNYVLKVDRASMSVSVEARTPFLDRRVADLALRFPPKLLLRKGVSKWVLREVGRRDNLLPDEIVDREKFGGSIASSWLDTDAHFRSFARAKILAPNRWANALGLREPMLRYFEHGEHGYSFPRAISIFRNLAWRLLMLELWSDNLGVEPTR